MATEFSHLKCWKRRLRPQKTTLSGDFLNGQRMRFPTPWGEIGDGMNQSILSCFLDKEDPENFRSKWARQHLCFYPVLNILYIQLGERSSLSASNKQETASSAVLSASLARESPLTMASEKSGDAVKKVVTEDDKKKETLDESTSRKRSCESSDNEDSKRVCSNVMDRAVELGFKDGDRIEVEWEVGTDDNVTKRWWPGTLLKHDGRTVGDVAIRVIEYDSYPDGGFPEKSQQDVIFVAPNSLLDPSTLEGLHFHREGEEAAVTFHDEDLDVMLMNVFQKHGEAFAKLSAAQQANVADIIAQGKERLLAAITSRWEAQPGKVITSEEVPEIMEQAFRDMNGSI